ncbi:nuclear pore complex protein An-Sac3 [Aspergillus sclerotiicarbonarius CBS 121057]|uniref:Nuclear pore complex protein An-Sac3 n=1 Tax=Aspergillus sclerotiicarbonarius (strain CBS 121057 / IBT 28362) TaxID=1448318 RepID=A0A319EAT9_ASPSB|nr:nuclear pore complex protein An-Sac3 [Aspergillus sclerotiicarbonarius CBS 121057]
MAGPPNPFAGLGQKDGPAGSAGRGRGGSANRPFQPKTTNPPRDTKPRGRGRGASSATRSGRGQGRGANLASNTWRNKSASQSASVGSTVSPFAPVKQMAPTSSPFAGQVSQQNSPFAGFGKASPSPFAAPSLNGLGANSFTGFHGEPSQKSTIGATGSSIPVEDISLLSSYTERYEQLKLDRTKEREKAIREGQMADPNQPTSLNQAITPVGTCTSMCPEFERVERIVQKMVDKSEKFLHPATNSLQNMEMKMLKRFRRSAAGYDEQLPSDIRTPKTLLQTMNYLIRHVIDGPEPLGLIHKFVWDRTRSIRNDFSVQQLTQEDHVKMAVTCLERIARFHIVSLHLLSSPANDEPFDRHQEREQLNNTMLSLMYYYDDNRGRVAFPNEDEFRAYYIIFSIHDQRPDLEARVQKWPAELRNSRRVQIALELFAAAGNTWEYQGTLDSKRPNAIAQGFYSRFFNMIESPGVSYLMACVAEIYFNHMRQTAIRSIWKGYCRYPASQQHKNEEWTVDELTTVLCFDDYEQTVKFCEDQDLKFAENANGNIYLDWGSRPVDSVAFQPSSDHSFSEKHVESKRAGRTLAAIILGLNIKESANLGMVDVSYLSERVPALPAPMPGPFTNDDSLFVSDDENVSMSSNFQVAEPPSQDESPRDSPASASSLRNAFAEFSQPGASTEPDRPAAFSFAQPPTNPQPSEAKNQTFSSLFPSSSPAGIFPAPATAASNPFAPATSPSTLPNLPQGESTTTFTPRPANQQPTSIFTITPQPSTSNNKENAPPFSSPAPFKFPTAFQPNTTSTSLPSTSAFSFDSKPDQANVPAAGQPAPSIFDTAKAPFSSGTPNSIFSFPGLSTVSAEAPAQQPQAASQPFGVALSQPSSVFASVSAPKNTEPTPLFAAPAPIEQSDTPPQAQVGNSIFQEKRPVHSDDHVALPLEHEEPPEPSAEKDHIPLYKGHVAVEPTHPSFAQKPGAVEAPVDAEASIQPVEIEPEQTLIIETPDEKSSSSDENSRRTAWLSALKEAADKRRDIVSNGRKRVHEEPEEHAPVESGPKSHKLPKAEVSIPQKKSLASASTKPLPKLPILEQIESLTARKPMKPKPEEPKSIQVDEDELLLSAARIAAESLRSGPKLLDGWSASYEPRSSYFSPGTSLSPSVALSRSQSPQSYVNGYEVSLAPDTDLGLGRTLSRTEQRIRMTGAKGLAYKPLDFTPDKKRKSR